MVGKMAGTNMPKTVERLTPLKVKNITEPGVYADGGGLYLTVSDSVAKSWIFRYSNQGRRREMGLGSVAKVGLADARKLTERASSTLALGIDPLDQRRELRLKGSNALTFSACAEQYIASHKSAWKNLKHGQQWENTLKTYAYPVIGDLTTDRITTDHILEILEPIWLEKAETATRVRGRIESILDWARTKGLREGENPARLKGHIDHLLPPSRKSKRVKHHAFLPWDDAPAFYSDLADMEGFAPKALKLVILTALRCGNVASAEWKEIDLNKQVWTIPGAKMKTGVEFRVPLSSEALQVIKSLPLTSEFLFPGLEDRPMTIAALTAVKNRMGREKITVHGFRTTFRTWASDSAHAPREVSEAALAHAVESKVEASYERTDHLERRRELMEKWADFLSSKANESLL
jgi:integrase